MVGSVRPHGDRDRALAEPVGRLGQRDAGAATVKEASAGSPGTAVGLVGGAMAEVSVIVGVGLEVGVGGDGLVMFASTMAPIRSSTERPTRLAVLAPWRRWARCSTSSILGGGMAGRAESRSSRSAARRYSSFRSGTRVTSFIGKPFGQRGPGPVQPRLDGALGPR